MHDTPKKKLKIPGRVAMHRKILRRSALIERSYGQYEDPVTGPEGYIGSAMVPLCGGHVRTGLIRILREGWLFCDRVAL
jgi:hypothetical protein